MRLRPAPADHRAGPRLHGGGAPADSGAGPATGSGPTGATPSRWRGCCGPGSAAVWIPDPVRGAVRDPVRARAAAMEAVRRAGQQLQGFPLRHGRVFAGRKAWSPAHWRWPGGPRFGRPASGSRRRSSSTPIDEAERRGDRLGGQIRELSGWSTAPVVAALQAMRGVGFLSAAVSAAEVGDFRRFATPGSWWPGSAWCPRGTRVAPRPGAAGSPRPATAAPGGCWSRVRGATASRRGSRA